MWYIKEMSLTDATYTIFDNHSQILTFPSDLTFRVYYLEATLTIFDNLIDIDFPGIIDVTAYHTGIGFQSTDKQRPYEFTLDLVVKNGFTLSSFLPEIRGDELIWNNTPANTIGNFIDRSYWERSTYICTISSQQVTDVMRWTLDVWKPNNPIYSLFYGIATRDDIFNPIFRPSFCDNYVYSAFFYLQGTDGGDFTDPVNTGSGLNVCVDYATPPNVSTCAFVSNLMTQVDFETNRDAILTFYRELEAELSDLVIQGMRLEEILQEIRADPGNIELILEAEKLLFEILLELVEIYTGFDVTYYYGYDGNNQPAYWRIVNPTLLLQYGNGNLLRSYPPLTANGQTVVDDFTCSTCGNCVNEGGVSQETIIIIIVIAVILVIVVIALMLWLMKLHNK